MRIMFVSRGCSCRAPALVGILRQRFPGWTVACAGTDPVAPGKGPYKAMRDVAHLHGVDISDVTTQRFKLSDFQAFDVFYAIDQATYDALQMQRPAGVTCDIRLLAEGRIADPYGQGKFGKVMQELIAAAGEISDDTTALRLG